MRSYRVSVLLICALFVLAAAPVEAWPEAPVSDPDVVHQAELIVVAHVKEGSIVYVPHLGENGRAMDWEHHATLVIAEVIKGHYTEKELPIIMHYGLSPGVPSDDDPVPHYYDGSDPWKKARPGSIITVYDIASPGGPIQIIGDILKDQIWFLRVQPTEHQKWKKNDSTAAPGIWDPEDLQPLDLKPYFQAFLRDHPEEKLREYADGEAPIAIRSRDYLDHLKLAEIMKEPDLAKRADQLLPFCLYADANRQGPTQREAMIQISDNCGQAGPARLVAVFKDPTYVVMQCDIINAWAGCLGQQYRDAIPVLTDMLKSDNAFWAGQTQAQLDLWIHTDAHHTPTLEQLTSRRRVGAIVSALGSLADPGTRPILEETKDLWGKLFPNDRNNEIAKRCDQALLEIRNEQQRKLRDAQKVK